MVRVYVPVDIARRVRESARNRCGYCLSPQHLVLGRLQIDHILPRSKGGLTEESNLWLCCSLCNSYKGDRTSAIDPETGNSVAIFNPRKQEWFAHFRWSDDGLHIVGLTPIGRATVGALHLNDDQDALVVRSYWVQAGWHPPKE